MVDKGMKVSDAEWNKRYEEWALKNEAMLHEPRHEPKFYGTFQDVFADIYKEAFDLLVERQRKYGPKNIESLGLFGVFGRLSDDKVERIKRGINGSIEHGVVTLTNLDDFDDESFEDALYDIANYALIMIALKRGLWGKPLDDA
jgi:hypothetical protein